METVLVDSDSCWDQVVVRDLFFLLKISTSLHMMPDLGSQFHCTLYTFIVLGKIMYSNIFYGIVFYCIVVLLCSSILLF